MAKTQYEDEGFIRAEGRKKTVDGKEIKMNNDFKMLLTLPLLNPAVL